MDLVIKTWPYTCNNVQKQCTYLISPSLNLAIKPHFLINHPKFNLNHHHHHRPPPSPPPPPSVIMSKGDEKKGFNLRKCGIYFLIIVVVLSFLAFILIHLFTGQTPKPPTYDLQTFTVKTFDVQSNNSIKTEFLIQIKTINPNVHFGFVYYGDNNVSVLYNDVVISSGRFRRFTQDSLGTIVVNMTLEGMIDPKSRLQDDVKSSKDKGGIPLLLNVEAPMSVLVGVSRVIQGFIAIVKCDLVVDGLTKGNTTKVLKEECQPHIKVL